MRGVVLLSGGLDSAVCLAFALRELEAVLCLTADYGQSAAPREIAAARALAAHYEMPHQIVELPFFSALTPTPKNGRPPTRELADIDLDDPEKMGAAAAAAWVPNRNGVLVNIGAAYAEAGHYDCVVAGFNREDARDFPDNSPGFVQAVNDCFRYSTADRVRLVSYTLHLDKVEIVQLGRRLGIPWDLIWSCYRGNDKPCGVCSSCLRLRRAMEDA